MSHIIKVAFHLPTQRLMHIDNASNGLSCECICYKCKERLEAVQGEVRIKHFRHNTNINCEGAQETALHELGKQILMDNLQIAIPGYGVISYSNPIPEIALEKRRPDVTATFDSKPIYFEIFVSHAVEEEKEDLLVKGKYRCVEIDLSERLDWTFEQIKSLVLDEIENKRVIYWDEESADPAQVNSQSSDGSFIGFLIFIGICIFAYLGLRTPSKGKAKRRYYGNPRY